MEEMDVQDLISNEIDRLKTNDSELYALDREKTKLIMETKEDISEMKAEQRNQRASLEELKDKMENVELVTTALSGK